MRGARHVALRTSRNLSPLSGFKASRVTGAGYSPNGAIRRPTPNTHKRDARALVPNSDHQRRFSRATGCVKKKKKCPSKRSVFTQRKSLFPVCNKTQTPGECQGAARLPTPDTSSSKQNHRDKPGKVRAAAEVRLQDDPPPLCLTSIY